MDSAFKVVEDGQSFDYRIPSTLDLTDVTNFFSVNYKVKNLAQTGRHVTGVLNKSGVDLFLKLSTTKGISILTKNEYKWNEEFNKHPHPKFHVPKNVASGEYNGLFYFLTEIVTGTPLATTKDFAINERFEDIIPDIIDFADYISSLNIAGVGKNDVVVGTTPQRWFVNKTNAWLTAIPTPLQAQHALLPLFAIVESGANTLAAKSRHGDFTPWHLILKNGAITLLDGEHAMSGGIESYDIAYLIQRVHTISNKPEVAQKIFSHAEMKGHNTGKLKTVLAARAIGGYLDAHLAGKTDFSSERAFKDWVGTL